MSSLSPYCFYLPTWIVSRGAIDMHYTYIHEDTGFIEFWFWIYFLSRVSNVPLVSDIQSEACEETCDINKFKNYFYWLWNVSVSWQTFYFSPSIFRQFCKAIMSKFQGPIYGQTNTILKVKSKGTKWCWVIQDLEPILLNIKISLLLMRCRSGNWHLQGSYSNVPSSL